MLKTLLLYSNDSRFGETDGYQSIGDVFSNGIVTFLLGILTVFAVLAIVWGTLELFHFIVTKVTNAKKNKVVETKVETPVVVEEEPSSTNDEEIVAVIAAAIAYAQAEKPQGQFRVVSFRKK